MEPPNQCDTDLSSTIVDFTSATTTGSCHQESCCDIATKRIHLKESANDNVVDDDVIETLSDFSARKLLNIDYLLGLSSQPFDLKRTPLEFYSKKPRVPEQRGWRRARHSAGGLASDDRSRQRRLFVDTQTNPSSLYVDLVVSEDDGRGGYSDGPPRRPRNALTLLSAKMKGLSGILSSEKLNASAIQLQLTAQSHTPTSEDSTAVSTSSRPKRMRRE